MCSVQGWAACQKTPLIPLWYKMVAKHFAWYIPAQLLCCGLLHTMMSSTTHNDELYYTQWWALLHIMMSSTTHNDELYYTQWWALLHTMMSSTTHNDELYYTQWWALLHTMMSSTTHNDELYYTQWWALLHTMMSSTTHNDELYYTQWWAFVVHAPRMQHFRGAQCQFNMRHAYTETNYVTLVVYFNSILICLHIIYTCK